MSHVTFEDACVLAHKLKAASPHIRHVELFGSVLRDGHGHDIDFVLIVDEIIARAWWRGSSDDLRVRMGTRWLPLKSLIKRFLPLLDEVAIRARKKRRQARASELLGFDIAQLAESYKSRMVVDAFLLPGNWREGQVPNVPALHRLAEIIKDDKETFRFLERVAQVAIRLV